VNVSAFLFGKCDAGADYFQMERLARIRETRKPDGQFRGARHDRNQRVVASERA
jgi:hypothetical protein